MAFNCDKFRCASADRTSGRKPELLKAEYKEFRFEPRFDPHVEKKIASFWEYADSEILPNISLAHSSQSSNANVEIESTENQDAITEEEELDLKWTNTLLMFRDKGLDEAATASKPKECRLCKKAIFSARFADECENVTDEIRKAPQENMKNQH